MDAVQHPCGLPLSQVTIDRFVELGDLSRDLASFYSAMGRPSVYPELMTCMLIVGYCFGIRSERRLCEELHLNLAYRWFCRLGLDAGVPKHSTFRTHPIQDRSVGIPRAPY